MASLSTSYTIPALNTSNHGQPVPQRLSRPHLSSDPQEEPFTLSKQLKTPNSFPINSLLFSEDAKYLLCGGDDETVRVWDMDTFQCQQTLTNDNWGQVTGLIWVYYTLPNKELITSLCVGSGRGYASLFPLDDRGTKPFHKPSASFKIFSFNDSVEQQASDRINHRLAFTSHSGEFKIYAHMRAGGSSGSLQLLWSTSLGVAIPRGVFFFGGANQSIITLGLENSEVCCREASKDNVLWKLELLGGIGGAAISTDEKLLLVNNLSTGDFDLYEISDDTPRRTLPTHSRRRVVKQCVFFEGTKQAVCGSDTNRVILADLAKNRILQTFITGKDEDDMTQTVAVSPASSRRVLIAGASAGFVFVWEKKPKIASPRAEVSSSTPASTERGFWASQGPAMILAILLTYNNWSPYLFRLVGYLMRIPSELKELLRSVDEI